MIKTKRNTKKIIRHTLKVIFTCLLVLTNLLTEIPRLSLPGIKTGIKEAQAITCGFGSEIGTSGVCRGFLTTSGSNQTWTSPSDWNNSNNTIECIGAGGSGGAASKDTSNTATGGGGGAYSLISNFSVATPGSTQITYRIGAGGGAASVSTGTTVGNAGGDTWWNNTTFPGSGTNNTYCGALGGGAGNAGAFTQNGGTGGAAASGWGETRRSGGSGGSASNTSIATGGGGAAGNSADGGAGTSSSTASSATNGGQANGSGASGGTGGTTGTDGGDGTEYTTEGSGGGGGGTRQTQNSAVYGGDGGKRGGGGGGAVNYRTAGTPSASSGIGYDGIIVITYTPPTYTISGTIYQENESSVYDCSSGGPYTVYLRVNGSGTYSGACSADTGAWEVTGVPVSSGQTIYAYLYNESIKGSTVLISSGTTKNDVPIYVNRVALRDDANGSITNSEILTGNTSDSDDLITTTGTDVVVGSSYETHIYTDDTFVPGANVSTGRMHVVGNYTAGSNTLTLTGTSGTLLTRTGTFTQDTSTVSLTSASGTPTFLSAATTFHKLTINSAATVINDGAAITLNNASGADLTITAGVLNFSTTPSGPGSGNGTLTIASGATMCLGGGATNTSASCNSVATSTTAVTMPTFQTYSFDASSDTIYLSDADTSISSSPTYGNLYLKPLFNTTSRTYTLGGAMTINGNFNITPDETGAGTPSLTVNSGGTITVAAGKTTTISASNSAFSTLDINPGTSYDLSTGTLYIDSGGTLDATSATSTITLTATSGTLFTRIGNFTITGGTPTVSVTGGTGTTLNSQTITFYNLTITPSGDSTVNASTDNISITNTLNITTGDTFNLPSGQTLTHSGSALTLNGTISGSGTYVYSGNGNLPTGGTLSSPVRIDATNGNKNVTNRTYGGDVELYNNSGTSDRTFTLGTSGSQTVTFNANLILNSAGANAITLTGTSNNPTVNITGNLAGTSGSGIENITTGTGTWTVSGNVDLTDIGTFTATGGTFQMNGISKTLTSASKSFNNFAVTGGSVSNTDSLDVNGTFGVSGSATFTHGAGANIDISIAGDFTLASGTTWVENTDSTSQVIFDGDIDYADNNSTKQSVGNVVIGTSPDTTNLTTDYSSNSLTIAAGDYFNTCEYEIDLSTYITINGTLDASASGNAGSVDPCIAGNEGNESTINIAANFTLASGGEFVADSSTLIMDDPSGSSEIVTVGTGSLYNLTISTGGAIIEVQDPLVVTNNLTISAGTLDVVSGENNQINVGGNWDNDATFEARSGSIVFDAISGTKTIDADGTGTDAFYNVTFSDGGSGPSYQLTTSMDTNNDLTISGGTLDANGQAMGVQGSWNNSGGTFTSNSNIVTFDDTDGGETLAGTMTGTSSFYDVVFNDGGNSGAWSFGSNSATVTHDLTITGGTVTAPSTTLTIAEDFTNSDEFTHNSGTIVFNTTATSILSYSAATTFNNFTVNTGNKQVKFDDTYQTNVAGLFNIQGTDCANLVYLDSETDNNAWDIYVSGTYDIDYADIEDSTAITTALTANNSTDVNGGNTNWTVNNGTCGITQSQVNIQGNTVIKGGTVIK